MGPLFEWGRIEEKNRDYMIHILRIRKKDQCFWLKTATGVCFVMFSKNVFVFCVMASLSIQCVGILRRAELLAPNILDHLKEPVLFQEQSLQRINVVVFDRDWASWLCCLDLTAILEEACTEKVCPEIENILVSIIR